MDDSYLHLDGNAAAGLLAAIFTFDVTTAETVCTGCGATGPIAALAAYGLPMGIILRCPGCDTALIRVAQVGSGYWLDLRGTGVMRVRSNS
jgi:hypothetical protein